LAYPLTLKMGPLRASGTIIEFHHTLHGVTSQETLLFIVIAVRTSNLVYYFSLRMKEKLANYRDAA
jgi:hypothetical protein